MKKTYDPEQVTITFNGVRLEGYADGGVVAVNETQEQAEEEMRELAQFEANLYEQTGQTLSQIEAKLREQADEPKPLPVHCTCGCDAFETYIDEHDSFRCITCKTVWRGLSMRDATVKTWSFSGTVKT